MDAPLREGFWYVGVVLHAAGNAAVVESPAHCSGVGGEVAGLHLPLLVVGGPQLLRAQWNNGFFLDLENIGRVCQLGAEHSPSTCHMIHVLGIVEIPR